MSVAALALLGQLLGGPLPLDDLPPVPGPQVAHESRQPRSPSRGGGGRPPRRVRHAEGRDYGELRRAEAKRKRRAFIRLATGYPARHPS